MNGIMISNFLLIITAPSDPTTADWVYRIIALASPFIIFVLGLLFSKKINKLLDTKLKLLFKEIQEIRTDMTRMESTINKHLTDDEFRQNFRNAIKRVVEKNTATPLLKQIYKNILAYYADSLTKFAFEYHYYPEKKKDTIREREKFLNREKTIMLDDFHRYVDDNIETIKYFKGRMISFSNFIKENRLYNPLELMIMELIKNGLEPNDIKNMFYDVLDKFCEAFITATLVWDEIKEEQTTLHEND